MVPMDPLGPPRDARFTGAFSRRPRNAQDGLSGQGAFGAPAGGYGAPRRPGSLLSLLMGILGGGRRAGVRRSAPAPTPFPSAQAPIRPSAAPAPAPVAAVAKKPRMCFGGT